MPNWYDQINDTFVKNVSIAYFQENPLSVFDIFPRVSTTKLAGLIAKYNKEDFLKIGDVNEYIRSGAVESVGDDYDLEQQSYVLKQFSFHKDITADDRANYDNPYDPINDAVTFVGQRLDRVILKHFISEYLTTGVWGTDVTAPTKWNAKTSGVSDADPVEDVLEWSEDIEKSTGVRPNKMIVTPDVLRALKTNTKILDKMKTTSDKSVTVGMLAKLFELDSLKVLGAVNEDGTNYMVTGTAWLGYTPAKASRYQLSAGYQMVYTQKGKMPIVSRIPMRERNNALRIEIDIWAAPVVVSSDCGTLITNLT